MVENPHKVPTTDQQKGGLRSALKVSEKTPLRLNLQSSGSNNTAKFATLQEVRPHLKV